MVRYNDTNKYDHQTGWFLPDDSIQRLGHQDKAAKRIVKEQLGYTLSRAQLNHVESFTGNDGTWHIPLHYFAGLKKKPKPYPSEDVAAVEWFELKKLPKASQVAHHGWALGTIAKILKDD